MLIDTHAHLNFKAFHKDLEEVIRRAQKSGVTKFIIPGAKLSSSIKAVAISEKYTGCFAAIGIHPHHADEYANLIKNTGLSLNNHLKTLIINPKVKAVGEIGMDYYQYKNFPPVSSDVKKLQIELLLQQTDLAVKYKLPVILHCRQAHDDMLNILKSYMLKNTINGVFHCFDGEIYHLKTVLNMGFYIGFDGNITYPENDRLRELIKYAPSDRILAETDAPFLTPEPFRGSRNEPKNLSYIVDIFAKLYNKSSREIGKITFHNATKLFHL